MKRAFISGITGQDGSYLAEYLLKKDYLVIGMIRRQSSPTLRNLHNIKDHPNLRLESGDMTDPYSLRDAISHWLPDEVYNLAAMSFVSTSWDQPDLTQSINFMGVLNLLEAVRSQSKRIRIYQASTSEMFGNVPPPQNEGDAMHPHSPYGVAKLAAHAMAKVYRDSYDMHISCGICFNHESPRRGVEFVTRKIARAVAGISVGKQDVLELGNLEAKRDFGSAKDYVKAMHLMLQQDDPDDYVIGTGESHSVGEFARLAFARAGITEWAKHVRINPAFFRPADIKDLVANASKAFQVLGWIATTTFPELVNWMVDREIERLLNDR